MSYCVLGPDDPALAALAETLRAHPEWETTLKILPWADYQPALISALKAETCPYQAVCAPGHVWLPSLIANGQLAAFDPLLGRLPGDVVAAYDADDMMPAVAAEARYSGKTYLLPVFTDGHLLFFDPEHVDLPEAGIISPLDLPSLAASAHLDAGAYPLALKAHPSEIFLDWLPFLYAAGGDVLDESGTPRFAGPEGVEALEEYVSLKRFCPPQPESYGNAEIAQALIEGRVAMAASWGGQAAVIYAGGSKRLGVAVYTHPWNTTWGICLPANQLEAVQVATLERLYRACAPTLDRQVTRIAGSPVRRSSYAPEEKAAYPWLEAQERMLGCARNLPPHPRLLGFLGDLYEAIFQAFTGQKTPQEALAGAERNALSILQ